MNTKLLMKGNEALAEAAIRCGCKSYFGYPITPQTEIAAYMAKRMPKAGGVYLQAESEISAINMVYGAAAAGIRSMTSSSSPGISLKTEGISYLIGADLPCVIVNVMRGGPGLGGIQPSQSDYWQATRAPGHGDGHLLVLAPAGIQEMVDLTYLAFDLADEYRMPVMILADGILGQMMEPVEFPQQEPKYVPKPWATNGHQKNRKHNIVNSLCLNPAELEQSIQKRFLRYQQIAQTQVRYQAYDTEDAKIVVVAYGATARIALAAVRQARKQGIEVGLIRPITLWPFPKEVLLQLAKQVESFLCVEMSMGQMLEDVQLAVNGRCPIYFFGHTGGVVPTPDEIVREILQISGGKNDDL